MRLSLDGGQIRRGWEVALGLFLPPRCLACGDGVETPGALCGPCWSSIDFLAPPCCTVCGFPFEFDMGDGVVCGACARHQPVYRRARAVMRYDDNSRGLILALKHGDRTDAAPWLGRWMARAGQALIAEADVIAPVPLHRLRLLSRRYNQSALLSHAIAGHCAVPCVPDLLIRRRRTPSQGGLSARGRARNVQGAFAVRPGSEALVRDRAILLVDDVLTTGATAEACARTLLRAGARAVDVLTLARVVRPQV